VTPAGPLVPARSPCTGVCTLDSAQRLCLGCGRTLGEIAEWPLASEHRRRQILVRLDGLIAPRASDRRG